MTNKQTNSVNKQKITFIVQFAVLLALEAIFCFTPLGSIPVGPIVASLGMLPVIITAFLLGTWAGTAMGFFAGLFSFIVWTFIPPSPMAIFFTPLYSIGELHGNFMSLLICFVPRILVGTVTGVLYNFFMRIFSKDDVRKNIFGYGIAAAAGSFTNTVLVLGAIYMFFLDTFAQLAEVPTTIVFSIIMGMVLTNGVPELVISAIVGYFVCRPLKKILSRQKLL